MKLLDNKCTLFLILFLLVCINLRSETVSGTIIDEKGRPLRDVAVINRLRKSADLTNENGAFKIFVELGDTLLLNSWGRTMQTIYNGTNDIIFKSDYLRSLDSPRITDELLSEITLLYASEKYNDCFAYCKYLLNQYEYDILTRHPYLNWYKNRFLERNNPLNVAKVYYLGSLSAYKLSLTDFDVRKHSRAKSWAESCVALLTDFLAEKAPPVYRDDANEVANYVDCSGMAAEAAAIGLHFLQMYDDNDVKKEIKWFSKKVKQISKLTYKNTCNKYFSYSEYPVLQYKLTQIMLEYQYNYGKCKDLNVFLDTVYTSTQLLIGNIGYYGVDVYNAINIVRNYIATILIQKSPNIKNNDALIKLCMEILIKLHDISYSINGGARYSTNPRYTLQDIQQTLSEDECAILHFESELGAGQLYSRNDLGSLYRNYALIITRDQSTPEIWHRGYVSDVRVNDFSKIKEYYSTIRKFYVVGTPRMSFIDVTGKDSTIVRLHSLSQLLDEKDKITKHDKFTFIGDLNYRTVGDLSFLSLEKGGSVYERLLGPAKELKTISNLFSNLHSITGDAADRTRVKNEILENDGIIHISTHGEIGRALDRESDFQRLTLKKDIMDNSKLILSGYTEDPSSVQTSISGSEILKLKKINAKLVYLDACLSGGGGVGTAGAVGIAEAFHLIGAQNVICYLEPVNDEIATMFSDYFYTELSKGFSVHDAFYNAKNNLGTDVKITLWE